ncbi:hypothetical protein VIGAN_08268900 [Vigna angularis var. angularis]|uniref:Uncharacterized protein n=1 Tax=Vigna angularis var. angularis TaxID=157739 RepID=A0A0S3SSQ4_PHAAN|nr:hypothetical protein VIGAN_08268900 [Vigna angularis var. angularis]
MCNVFLITLKPSQISVPCPINFSDILVSMTHNIQNVLHSDILQSLHHAIQPHIRGNPAQRMTHCDANTSK